MARTGRMTSRRWRARPLGLARASTSSPCRATAEACMQGPPSVLSDCHFAAQLNHFIPSPIIFGSCFSRVTIGYNPRHARALRHCDRGSLRGPPREHASGRRRARAHCRFAPPFILSVPDSLTYLVHVSLKRQCDRTLGRRQTLGLAACADDGIRPAAERPQSGGRRSGRLRGRVQPWTSMSSRRPLFYFIRDYPSKYTKRRLNDFKAYA